MAARYLVRAPERWELPFTEMEDMEGRAGCICGVGVWEEEGLQFHFR